MVATPHELYRDSSPDTSPLPVRTVNEVISEAGANIPWVIENLLARGAVTEFSGSAKKGGKTTFWCHAIAAGARGENHAGFATEPAKYLYLTEQDNNSPKPCAFRGLSNTPTI
jgi:AAA domain